MARQIRVLLVDEVAERRAEIERTLVATDEVEVVAEAGYGVSALTLAREHTAQIALVGMEEPISRALRTIESFHALMPAVGVVVVSSLVGREYLRRAMVAGARDYLPRPASQQDLLSSFSAIVSVDERSRAETAEQPTARAEVITVFGTKGGIGKTTLSVNLATALRDVTKAPVVVLDLDVQLGDVSLMFDVTPMTTAVDLLPTLDTLTPEELQAALTPHSSGVFVLPACLQPEKAANLNIENVRKLIQKLASAFDYVVVDTAPNLDELMLSVLDISTFVLLLTTREVTCLKNTRVFIDMLRQLEFSQDKVKMVINDAVPTDGVKDSQVETLLEYPVFWTLPNDRVVADSVRKGRPFVGDKPSARISRSVVDLARLVGGVEAPKRKGRFGF